MSDAAYKFVLTMRNLHRTGKIDSWMMCLLVVASVVMCWIPFFLSATLNSWRQGSERGLIMGLMMLVTGILVPHVFRLQARIETLEKKLADVEQTRQQP